MPPRAGTPPTIYLTFDDGPNPEWTPALLDALDREDVRATFFLIDEHITPETAPVVRRIAEEGHAIGLHSGTRRLMLMEPEALASQLTGAANRHYVYHWVRALPAVPSTCGLAQRLHVPGA